MYVGVAWGSAPLSTPGHLAPNNFLGCVRQICSFIHNGRVLTAEFKEDWRQILGGCACNNFSRAGAASEENEIKRKFEKLCCLFAVAGHCCHCVRVKVFGNQIEQ